MIRTVLYVVNNQSPRTNNVILLFILYLQNIKSVAWKTSCHYAVIMEKRNQQKTKKGLEQKRRENLFPQTIFEKQFGTKFTKWSKIYFFMECFTVDFLQFFNKKPQKLTFGWTAGYSPLNPNILGIFLKLLNFLRS